MNTVFLDTLEAFVAMSLTSFIFSKTLQGNTCQEYLFNRTNLTDTYA